MLDQTQELLSPMPFAESFDLEDVLFSDENPVRGIQTSSPPFDPEAFIEGCSCGGRMIPLGVAAGDPNVLRSIVPGAELRNLRSLADWLSAPQTPILLQSRLHDKAKTDAMIMCGSCLIGFVFLGVILTAGHMPPILGALGVLSALGAAGRVFARTKRIASQEDLILTDLFGVRVDTYHHRTDIYQDLRLCTDCLEVSHPEGRNGVKWFSLLEMYELRSGNSRQPAGSEDSAKSHSRMPRMLRHTAAALSHFLGSIFSH